MRSGAASDRAILGRSAAFASIVTALLLVGLKLWAVWQTDSMALLGSLADSALDLIASLATLTGVIIAARPADRTHRFGHGKAEALAAIFQVMLIALSAAGIAMQSAEALAEGGRPALPPAGAVRRSEAEKQQEEEEKAATLKRFSAGKTLERRDGRGEELGVVK